MNSAFSLSRVCTKFSVKPLEFDGINDSMLHEFDATGRKHLEYVRDHGHFADLPFERILEAFMKTYPLHIEGSWDVRDGDFHKEAELENL